MRLNKYLAAGTRLSRRGADDAIAAGRVVVNGRRPEQGMDITKTDSVVLDGAIVQPVTDIVTIMLHKPRGVVVSRDGQGSSTVYDILPEKYHQLNPIGRLDKDSSGLLLLTNDGTLAHDLTHPSRQKLKVYTIALDKDLLPLHRQMISDYGLQLEDGISKLQLERAKDNDETRWIISMHEGRNRQIRRTFGAVGYTVRALHRIKFGDYALGDLKPGASKEI
jgi:23S rRNA pseudouridine2605 synthase